MNSMYFRNKRKSKLLILILLVFVSLLSVYTPYDLLEKDNHNSDYVSLLKYFIGMPAANFNKLRNQIKTFLSKVVFMSILIQANSVALANIRLFLLNIRFPKNTIIHLYYFICFYFNGGKFKDNLMPLLLMGN